MIRFLREAAWIIAIAMVSGLFMAIVAIDTFHRTSSLSSVHVAALETGDFIGSINRAMLDIASSETYERGFRLTHDPALKAQLQATSAQTVNDIEILDQNGGPAFHDDVVRFGTLIMTKQAAIDKAVDLPSASDDGDNLMASIRNMGMDLRQRGMDQLHLDESIATSVEHRAVTRLAVTMSFAILCILGAVIGAQIQGEARRRMTRRLQNERLSAIAANRTKSSFLAYTSHELRTPLNAIIGFSEFMMMEYAGPLTDRQKQYLSDIRGSGLHLQALISDILDLTKAEAGKITLSEQNLDIPKLVGSCLKLVEGQAKEADVSLVQSLAPDLPEIRADELRCKQILINVAINAIQNTPAGGQVLIAASREPNGSIVFRIADTGKGIPAEDLPKVIEPYFRSGIDEPSHKGYGLGLPLARKIAELHGGTLVLTSEVGVGTTVTITLPASRVVAAGERPEGAQIIPISRKIS
jgi:signal transduction histidine kinase